MKSRWAYRLFNALVLLALPLIAIVILLKWRRRVFARGLDRWGERWGRWPPATAQAFSQPATWWWVHAVSLGEVKAIETFLRRAPQVAGVKILLSVVTPEALVWAADHQVAAVVIAAPIDLPWIVRRCMRVVRPQVFISVESEFWPNMLREAKRSGARVALINGRISQRSFQSYSKIRFLLDALWETIDLWAVRQREDAERFTALGVDSGKMHVTGNLKYDVFVGPRGAALSSNGERHRPVVVMGSTRDGEESALLPALEQVRAKYPNVRVIWAPRHIERVQELETLFASQGLAYEKKSLAGHNGNGVSHPPYLLWDSMGDLLDAYRQADIAVIGGSFVQKGGQNPIEPAALKLPVLFGPSMENFQAVAETLVHQGGARRVSTENLGAELVALLNDPAARRDMGERALRAVESEQGATDRTLKLLMDATHGFDSPAAHSPSFDRIHSERTT